MAEKEGSGDGRSQHPDHDEQGDMRGDVVEIHEEHLDPDIEEDDGDAMLQENEHGDDAGKEEIEGAKAQDGEDVRGVDDEGVRRDGEYGGDGIHREDQV